MSEVTIPPFQPINANGIKVVILIGVFWTLGTIFVGLRFYARRMKGVGVMVEDWLVLGALLSYYGFGTVNLLAVIKGGAGHHVADLGPSQLQYNLKVLLCGQIFYAVGLGLVKCSITTMLIRIFSVKSFRIAGYFVLALCVAWSIMTILIAFLLCRPLGYNWNLLPTAGHCGNQLHAYAAVGITDIITDAMILVLPMPMIYSLHLPKGNKIALAGLMCLGIFTIGMSIARVVTILNTNFQDFTFNIYNFIWPVVEFGVAIVVCCGPILRPMFNSLASFRSRITGNSGKQNSSMLNSNLSRKKGYSDIGEDGTPLKSISMPVSNTVITVENTHDNRDRGSEHTATESFPKNGIVVKTQWDAV